MITSAAVANSSLFTLHSSLSTLQNYKNYQCKTSLFRIYFRIISNVKIWSCDKFRRSQNAPTLRAGDEITAISWIQLFFEVDCSILPKIALVRVRGSAALRQRGIR
jgi:hypothetical protein